MPYSGEVEVEDDVFELRVERLIIREGEIAFVFRGKDESGEFRIEGRATKSVYGFYMAPKLPLFYSQYAGEDVASIKIDGIKEITGKKKNKCEISGTWIQSGDSWGFTGELCEYIA